MKNTFVLKMGIGTLIVIFLVLVLGYLVWRYYQETDELSSIFKEKDVGKPKIPIPVPSFPPREFGTWNPSGNGEAYNPPSSAVFHYRSGDGSNNCLKIDSVGVSSNSCKTDNCPQTLYFFIRGSTKPSKSPLRRGNREYYQLSSLQSLRSGADPTDWNWFAWKENEKHCLDTNNNLTNLTKNSNCETTALTTFWTEKLVSEKNGYNLVRLQNYEQKDGKNVYLRLGNTLSLTTDPGDDKTLIRKYPCTSKCSKDTCGR